jgi:hypothetical protein
MASTETHRRRQKNTDDGWGKEKKPRRRALLFIGRVHQVNVQLCNPFPFFFAALLSAAAGLGPTSTRKEETEAKVEKSDGA